MGTVIVLSAAEVEALLAQKLNATDLAEAVDDRIGTFFQIGSGLVRSYDDAGNAYYLSADPEYIRDTMATALVQGTGITITANDAGDTITISASGGSGVPTFGKTLPFLDDVAGMTRTDIVNSNSSDWLFIPANTTFYYPVWYSGARSIDGFGVHLRGSAAGSTVRVGIFAPRSGVLAPGNVLAQTTFAGDVSGWKQATITPVAMGGTAGWYWHACSSTAAMDIHCRNVYAPLWQDGSTIEAAVRADDNRRRSYVSTGAGFTNNPTVTADGRGAPIVGVRMS